MSTQSVMRLTTALDELIARLEVPGEPFAETPVVIGDPLMEGWVRHRVAERSGVAMNLIFLTVDAAIDMHLRPAHKDEDWWRREAPEKDRWNPASVRGRVIDALRALRGDGVLADLESYLWPTVLSPDAVGWRELAFAGEVAAVILRLCRERPEVAAEWGLKGTGSDPAWLARVARLVETAAPDSPATLRANLLAGPPVAEPGAFEVLGLTAASATTRSLLAKLGAKVPPFEAALRSNVAAHVGREAVRLRPCYGALREVEELRAWLLHRFDLGLEPQEVLVMTPSPETYGPLVLSVFGRRGASLGRPDGDDAEGVSKQPEPSKYVLKARRLPQIPVHVTQMGNGQSNPLAEAVLELLALADERLDAPRLVSLLACDALLRRFSISADDVEGLRSLLIESGARWGLDADDRSRVDQPRIHQNTFAHALERMALGRLMPTDTLLGTDGAELGPVVAMETGDRAQARRVSQLGHLIASLRAEIGSLRAIQQATPAGWRACIDGLLKTFTDSSAAMAWLRLDLTEKLDELLPLADGVPLDRSALRRLLEAGFTLPLSGPSPNSGSVTMNPLSPHLARPFKVVALLGMNDGAFPRSSTLRQWDPFQKLTTNDGGEIDPRALDRALLCDLAAGCETLWISWTAYEMKRGEGIPPCVPVSELATALDLDLSSDHVSQDPDAERTSLDAALRHPARHPWEDRPKEGIWDAEFAQLQPTEESSKGRTAEVSASRPVGLDPELPREVSIDELYRALLSPAEYFLKNRLDVFIPDDDPAVPGRERIEPEGGLGVWKVKDEILEELRSATDGTDLSESALTERTLSRIAGRGDVLLGAAGRENVKSSAETVLALWKAWLDAALPASETAKEISAEIETPDGIVVVRGVAARYAMDETGVAVVHQLTVSEPKGKHLLRSWLVQLTAAAGSEVGGTVCRTYGVSIRKPDIIKFGPITPAAAQATLADLLSIWRLARTRPVELFEGTSAVLAMRLDSNKVVSDTARLEAEASWFERKSYGDNPGPAESESRWNVPFFRHFDPRQPLGREGPVDPDGLVGLAERVWGRLNAASKSNAAPSEAQSANVAKTGADE